MKKTIYSTQTALALLLSTTLALGTLPFGNAWAFDWNPFSKDTAPASSLTPSQPASKPVTKVSEKEITEAQKKVIEAQIRADFLSREAETARKEAETAKALLDNLLQIRNPGQILQQATTPVYKAPESVKPELANKLPEPTVAQESDEAFSFLGWLNKDKENKDKAKKEETAKATESKAVSKTASETPSSLKTASSALAGTDYLATAKKMRAAVMETEKGNVTFELYPEEAPITVTNFSKLVSQNFYNQQGMMFHRVVPGFVVQTGDPTGTGAGGSRDKIPLEVENKLTHDAKGVVAMARSVTPNSASSQFYITLAPQKSLDAKYAIFGRVISGAEVLDKIEKGTKLYGVKLVDIKTVARDPEPKKESFFKKML